MKIFCVRHCTFYVVQSTKYLQLGIRPTGVASFSFKLFKIISSNFKHAKASSYKNTCLT